MLMRLGRKKKQKSGRFSWILLAVCVLLLAVQAAGIVDPAEWRVQDARYQKGGLVSPEILVIGIDEETMMEYGSWQNWSRTGTAKLLEVLNQNPETAPAVIGLDIGFFGESDASADKALAEAAALLDNVVMTSYASFGKEVEEGTGGAFLTRESVVTYEIPYAGLREHVSYGFSNVPVDKDGVVRHSLYSLRTGDGETVYSFAAEVYRKYRGELPPCVQEGRALGYIPFSAQPFEYYGSESAGLSFSKVVSGDIPADLFAGSIVLVGPYTTGMMDAYYTAIRHDIPMYGVEIHANILQAFLEDNQKTESGRAAGILLSAGAVLFVCLCLGLPRLRYALLLVGLLLAVYWQIAGMLYEKGRMLPLLYPMGSAVLVCAVYIVVQYAGEHREKKRLEGIFGKYVSKEVAASIVRGGEEALKLGGQKQDVAVLFVDIRNFTPLSESLPPEKVVEVLNHCMKLTTRAVFANEGTVDKFIGDAVMAIYNAPLDVEDYCEKAVQTAYDIIESMNQDTGIVILLNPNSPIGTVYKEWEMRKIIEKARQTRALVVIDEAYHYFYESTVLPLIKEYDNLLVLRTFSKLFSMAGLRIGYVSGNAELISYIEKAESTFNVNNVAILFAQEVVSDEKLIRDLMEKERAGKLWLSDRLREAGYRYISMEGNYVLFYPKRESRALVEELKRQDIWVRDYGRGILKGWIRVSVGSVACMERFWKTFIKADRK